MASFGKRSTFCMEVSSSSPHPSQREVNVWADRQLLTCEDNTIFVTQFLGSLEEELTNLLKPATLEPLPYPSLSPVENHKKLKDLADEDNKLYLAYRFMDWGPTADNVLMTKFILGDTVYLPFEFWRESHHEANNSDTIFCAVLPLVELQLILHRAAWDILWMRDALMSGNAPSRRQSFG